MRALIDEHETELVNASSDRVAGIPDRRAATFSDVAWAWHEHGRLVAGWKPATVRDRRSTLRAHLIPAFGARPIRELSRDEVRHWWRGLHDPRRSGGRLSDRNANKLLAELRAILNWAGEDYRLIRNVADGIRKHRELTSERPDFYSVEEVEALTRAAASPRDALLYRVAAFAGLRRGELVSLRWRHIDFARSLMHIVENVSAGQDARVKDGEGRTVPLAPQIAEVLAAWRPDGASEDELVFPGALPERKLDGDALSARYCKARDAAGLRRLRFHDLRHTFGSLAVDGGASLVQVQAWMGHADVKTTMRYLHTKSRTEDAALLGAAFTSGALAQVDRAAVASR
jgi:integrase